MLVVVNPELAAQIAAIRERLNADSVIRLFKNDATITPAIQVADLVEANFSGYAQISLDGDWTEPVKTEEGIYTISAGPNNFQLTGGVVENTVYGAFVLCDDELFCVEKFAMPLAFVVGMPVVSLTVSYRQQSQSAL